MAGKIEKQKAKKGFRIFLKHVLYYKRTILFLSILAIISAIINGATPFIAGKFFDSILKMDQIRLGPNLSIPLWSFLISIWVLLQIIARLLELYFWWTRTNFRIVLEDQYVLDGMKKLLHLPLSFHKDNKLGDIVSRVERAASRLNNGFDFVIDVSAYVLSGLAGLAFVFYINYAFGLVMVGAIVFYILIVLRILAPLGKMQKESSELNSKAYGDFYDAIGNIKIVKQNASEEFEYKKFYKKYISGSQKLLLKVNGREGWSFGFQEFVTLSIQISIFVISVFFIRSGKMTLGELFAVNGYSAMVFGPFTYFVRWWDWLQKCFVALEKADKVFGKEDEVYAPKNVSKNEKMAGNVEFKKTNFSYKEGEGKRKKTTNVLKNVSFKINKGETVALVGESGVGKTTIADLISGFYFPQRGQILIDGIPTDKIPLQFLRKNIAVVSQDITIFNESIKYNIRYGHFNINDREVVLAAKKAGAHEFISRFKKKYNQLVGERGVKLSGGQRQRVAIAQAILKKASILILDEPTSALDARTEKLVTESLEKLMEGRTTIIIAHRLSTVKKADKIIVLDKGRVVEIGKHKDLIKKKRGIYRKFYEVQKL